VQIQRIGKGAVAAAGDDGLEGADERAEPGKSGIGGDLLEQGRGGGPVAREQGLGEFANLIWSHLKGI
jgi:hypothetical protein